MEKNKNTPLQQPAGSMLNQKTNEDFNQKKPSSSDPNEQKNRPETTVPDIGDNPLKPVEGKITGRDSDQQKAPNKSEGSE